MLEKKALINLYVKYFNQSETYEKEYQKSFSSLRDEIVLNLSEMDLPKLIELYISYADINKFKKEDVSPFLNLLYEVIISKLNSISYIKLIDLYADIFNNILGFEESYGYNKSIVSVRTYNISDDYYIESQAKRKNKSKEEFLADYKSELAYYRETLKLYEKAGGFLNKLEDGILFYLESELEKISPMENEQLTEALNNRIEANLNAIQRRKKLLSNKTAIDIETRFKNVSMSELYKQLDTSSLKYENFVYESYRESLLKSRTKKSQK